ncbi:MAG: hypothetical protein QOI66_2025 [Myxococcales bacterium]|nr:hypothetical protein [Myxococcales bacterium]
MTAVNRCSFLVFGIAIGCGSASLKMDGSAAGGVDGGADTGTLPACNWPAELDGHDAGAGACVAARTLLSCAGANGVSEECISDDPNQCAGENAMPGVSFTCHDLCGPDEYGAVCGSVGPGPISDPPAGCHNAQPTPAGTIFYCCPCL